MLYTDSQNKFTPFRYLGFKIQAQQYERRYCDVLDRLTQTLDSIQKSPVLRAYFDKNPNDAVICTYKYQNVPSQYLGCICYAGKSGEICTTFGIFDSDRQRLDISLNDLRKLVPDDWEALVYYTEQQATQLDLKRENKKAVIVDRGFGLSELDFILNDGLENCQKVEDLKLEDRALDEKLPHIITTREELHSLAEKSRRIADKRREESAR